MSQPKPDVRIVRHVLIPTGSVQLEGELVIPSGATGIVLFAHGSGSSRHSPRNKYVARTLHEASIGTLLFDLLTQEEEAEDRYTARLRFDIALLARRLADATRWVRSQEDLRGFSLGFFGSSTGAAAALVATVELGGEVSVVVSRGGRPDLAGAALEEVSAPTLLIVGGLDEAVIGMNLDAHDKLRCKKLVEVVDGATHLFEEPGALEEVARLATDWFGQHFRQRTTKAAR